MLTYCHLDTWKQTSEKFWSKDMKLSLQIVCWKYGLQNGSYSLQWHHNGHNGISNHQPHDCLLNRLFRRRSKKTSKLHVSGLYVGNAPVTGEFPAQKASNAENVFIWWCHHVCSPLSHNSAIQRACHQLTHKHIEMQICTLQCSYWCPGVQVPFH